MIHINRDLTDDVSAKAKNAKRKRINHNFHKVPEDTLQRMLNALEPETYVCPHKHEHPDKREAFIILKGRVLVVEFYNDGRIRDHIVLDYNKGNFGAEISPRVYHTLIALELSSIIYEIKDGPYNADNDKNFAPWAPEEGNPEAGLYNEKILKELNIK
jgi:cupin fold WbuC family metalloprotein